VNKKAFRANRRYRRRTIRVLVEYASGDGLRCEVATTLGAGGIFIETETPELEGSRLKLSFQLSPDSPTHKIEGRVVWSQFIGQGAVGSPGMGIEFTDRQAMTTLALELEALD
jgi:Tfp pilus assembly protein PilZ